MSKRPPGSLNRATIDAKIRLSDLARVHCEMAIETLAEIARDGNSDAARIAAACALLNRGYGKPREASPAQIAPPEDPFFPFLSG